MKDQTANKLAAINNIHENPTSQAAIAIYMYPNNIYIHGQCHKPHEDVLSTQYCKLTCIQYPELKIFLLLWRVVKNSRNWTYHVHISKFC